MPYRKQQFVNGEIYHIVMRGIDNNLLFKNIDDYYRGVFSIYEFNNSSPVSIKNRRRARARLKKIQAVRGRASDAESVEDKRDKLVEVLAFCFMPNHIHLLAKQLKDDGITKFMSKVGTGYGRYFNTKYNRRGYVFQNRFSAVHIKDNDQLKNAFVYVHTNPAAIVEPKWKDIGIKNPEKVINFLESYKWSSYADYTGRDNFPSLTNREFILKIMGGRRDCREFVEYWIKYKGKMREFAELALE